MIAIRSRTYCPMTVRITAVHVLRYGASTTLFRLCAASIALHCTFCLFPHRTLYQFTITDTINIYPILHSLIFVIESGLPLAAQKNQKQQLWGISRGQ